MKLIHRAALAAVACALAASTAPAIAPAAENVTLTADVASSSFKPLDQIFREFEKKHPGVKIVSAQPGGMSGGDIQTAVDTGKGVSAASTAGDADIVVVGETQTKYLEDQGRIAGSPVAILTQKEAVLVPWSGSKVKTLKDLANSGLKLGMAEPNSAVGRPAAQMLKNASKDPAYGSDFGPKVIQNVQCHAVKGSDVPLSVKSGQCDAAIGFISDQEPPHVRAVIIPDSINVATPYYAFVPKASKNQKIGDELVKFIVGKQGMAILSSYHYLPPPKK